MLITDIDNTLYDFVDVYGRAFRAMVHVLSKEAAVPEKDVYEQLRRLFMEAGTLEFQNLVVNLPLSQHMCGEKKARLRDYARVAFDKTKRKHLRLYPGMLDVLSSVKNGGVKIVGVTNAPFHFAARRLGDLRVSDLMTGLLAWRGASLSRTHFLYDEDFVRKQETTFSAAKRRLELAEVFSKEHSKPAPYAFDLVRRHFGDVRYFALGDSLAKDLAPAKNFGMTTIWAKYGGDVDPTNLETILQITPWNAAEMQMHTARSYEADYVACSPKELLSFLPHQMALDFGYEGT